MSVVVATAKVQIFKQITTGYVVVVQSLELLLLPQRYKFSSKSQHVASYVAGNLVVVATAKVQIFKQITTCLLIGAALVMLLLLPQRYKFSSKSQRHCRNRCHKFVVVATAKVQIFKQITTSVNRIRVRVLLLLLPQRYKFSSKSQLALILSFLKIVVVATAKVQIFKQITTTSLSFRPPSGCCCYRKGTNFQANHNRCHGEVLYGPLLLLPQRYKFSSKSQRKVKVKFA